MTVEDFIIKNFKTITNNKDRLHTTDLTDILVSNGYLVNIIECSRLLPRIGIGKYNEKCNINNSRKKCYDFIKFIGNNNEI